jgi:hypothetical protein
MAVTTLGSFRVLSNIMGVLFVYKLQVSQLISSYVVHPSLTSRFLLIIICTSHFTKLAMLSLSLTSFALCAVLVIQYTLKWNFHGAVSGV